MFHPLRFLNGDLLGLCHVFHWQALKWIISMYQRLSQWMLLTSTRYFVFLPKNSSLVLSICLFAILFLSMETLCDTRAQVSYHFINEPPFKLTYDHKYTQVHFWPWHTTSLHSWCFIEHMSFIRIACTKDDESHPHLMVNLMVFAMLVTPPPQYLTSNIRSPQCTFGQGSLDVAVEHLSIIIPLLHISLVKHP